MTRETILNDLHEIFWDIFDDECIKLNEKTTSNDVEDWDSLEHINLIVAVEERFAVKFSMGEVTTMKDVGAMIDIIVGRI